MIARAGAVGGWARGAAVVLLLLAVAGKTVQVATDPDPRLGVWGIPAWLLAGIILVEGALAWWLIRGTAVRRSTAAAAALFAVFAGGTITQIVARQTSCGCFGPVTVPPVLMLVMDLLLAAALAWRARAAPPAPERHRRSLGLGVAGLALLIGTVLVGVRPQVLERDAQPGPAGSGPAAAGRPPTWRYLPGMQTGIADVRLSAGRWQIICYRYACPHCQAHIGAWVAHARAAQGRGERWGFLWLDDPAQQPDLLDGHALGDLPRWQRTMAMMRTPALLTVQDGVISTVRDTVLGEVAASSSP